MNVGSEGWTNVPPPDGTDSRESSLSGPSLLEEEVPENLGCGGLYTPLKSMK